MATVLTADDADRLIRRAMRRRADGSRRMRARRAWRRLVAACAGGDAAVQDVVRRSAADLSERDVLDLLAAAPEEPADRAAYLALIGQDAQRQALDPDGAQLALAYRAADARVRERLRARLATEGDAGVIRVVITGDRRDRIAEMSRDEVDYLAHHLAERQSWDELRRLALDLPPAGAVETARLLPATERTGDSAALLEMLAEQPPGHLQALVDRLPRRRLLTHTAPGRQGSLVSLSPDASELAVMSRVLEGGQELLHVETLRLSTGEVTRLSHGPRLSLHPSAYDLSSLLHLGDEILMREHKSSDHTRIVRVLPDLEILDSHRNISDMRRSSAGAVMIYSEGLAFVHPGSADVRYQPISRFSTGKGGRMLSCRPNVCSLASLPESRLIAFCSDRTLYVANEDGDVLHEMSAPDRHRGYAPAVSFRSESSLAAHWYITDWDKPGKPEQYTEIWDFSPGHVPHRTGGHRGPIRDGWPLEDWRGMPLDAYFAMRMLSSRATYGRGPIDTGIPWLRSLTEPRRPRPSSIPELRTMSPRGDTLVVAPRDGGRTLDVHSPHLPSALEHLQRPLVKSNPRDLRRVDDLRSEIGDPAVRDALALLRVCLEHRFGGDIALGGTDPVTAGGPHDIAITKDRTELPGTSRGDA